LLLGYQHALAIHEKALGPEHPSTATSLNNLATLYRAMDDYTKVEPLYQRALTIYEKSMGPEHPSTADNLNNLAELYASSGKSQKAHQLQMRTQAIDEKMIEQVSGFTSESQTMRFLATSKGELDCFLSLVNQHLSQDASATIDAANVWLKRKGFVLEAQKRFKGALLYAGTPFQKTSRHPGRSEGNWRSSGKSKSHGLYG